MEAGEDLEPEELRGKGWDWGDVPKDVPSDAAAGEGARRGPRIQAGTPIRKPHGLLLRGAQGDVVTVALSPSRGGS